jgi:hypothetical protein
MKNTILKFIFISLIFLFSCTRHYNKKLTDKYYVNSLDEDVDMSISYEIGEGAYIDVVKATVFAFGYNDDFIIAKQHPIEKALKKGEWKATTNYFIIPIKNPISQSKDLNVLGPLTLEQLNEKRQELAIPDNLNFTEEFENLK